MESRRDVFQAIADPTRRAILTLLAMQALTPGAIADNFQASRQTISKHIQILTECELLKPEQNGREIYYHINAKQKSMPRTANRNWSLPGNLICRWSYFSKRMWSQTLSSNGWARKC